MDKRFLFSVHEEVKKLLLLSFYAPLGSQVAVCPLYLYSSTNSGTQEGESKSRSILQLGNCCMN